MYDTTDSETPARGRQTGTRTVRILLVAHPDLVTESRRRALDSEPDIVLVAETPDLEIDVGALVGPDNGIRPPVVLLSDHASGRDLAAALSKGCVGLVASDGPFSELVATLRVVADGGTRVPRSLLPDLTAALHGRSVPTELSDRELEVLALLAEGLSTDEWVARLTLSVHTVRNHIRSVMAKLGAHSRLEAVVLATRKGLLDGGSIGRWPEPPDPGPRSRFVLPVRAPRRVPSSTASCLVRHLSRREIPSSIADVITSGIHR